jgi:hypothetical protein
VIKKSEVAVPDDVYEPNLNPSLWYKGGFRAIPPLLIAISNNSGSSWSYKFISDKGGITPGLAYDAGNDILVIAYGGLTYPRKGVALQYSTDKGDTWSNPINISEEEGFTYGNAFVAKVTGKTFVVIYTTSDKYNVLDKSAWKINSKLITFD